MRTMRQYLSGCTWCNATGIKYPMQDYGTGMTNICPVCQGSKTMPVTETFEDESEDQPKRIFQTPEEYYKINPKHNC